jgi:hypothetical protein
MDMLSRLYIRSDEWSTLTAWPTGRYHKESLLALEEVSLLLRPLGIDPLHMHLHRDSSRPLNIDSSHGSGVSRHPSDLRVSRAVSLDVCETAFESSSYRGIDEFQEIGRDASRGGLGGGKGADFSLVLNIGCHGVSLNENRKSNDHSSYIASLMNLPEPRRRWGFVFEHFGMKGSRPPFFLYPLYDGISNEVECSRMQSVWGFVVSVKLYSELLDFG